MTTEIIAELNDRFRRHENRNLGRYMMTPGVQALTREKQFELVQLVKGFNSFTEGNDSYGEHDFGKVTMDEEDYFWRIDYYDLNMEYLSSNPADPTLTRRIMTIMRSNEY